MMTSDPSYQVSFAILCWNERDRLDACLAAVRDQTFPRSLYEIVVFDNGSWDGSAEYVEQHFPDVRVVRLGPSQSCSSAANRMVQHLRSPYMAFVNPDCVIHKNWLAEMMKAMKNEPLALMAHSNIIHPWYLEWAAQERDQLVEHAYVCDMTLLGVHDFCIEPLTPDSRPVPTIGDYNPAGVIDVSVSDKTGYFVDPDFYCYAEDLDMALRVNLSGYKVLFVPKAIAYHDAAWTMNLRRWTLRKAMLSTRNTILAFYKISYGPEFLVMLPLLLLGNIHKARQHALSPIRQWLYTLAAIPQTLLALAEALWKLPSYRARRQETLRHRTAEWWWLFHRVRRRRWKPDPSVWLPGKMRL